MDLHSIIRKGPLHEVIIKAVISLHQMGYIYDFCVSADGQLRCLQSNASCLLTDSVIQRVLHIKNKDLVYIGGIYAIEVMNGLKGILISSATENEKLQPFFCGKQ